MIPLTLDALKTEAKSFAAYISQQAIPELYGITDGKKVGTYIELRLNEYLADRYTYVPGSAAIGIDFPELEVDVKATSLTQPQSSSPFRSATQKVYGLGYGLLVFVYEKVDDLSTQTTRLTIQHVIFIARERTADYQTTMGLIGILSRNGNKDDVAAFLEERNLPLDDIGREKLAEQILQKPPEIGALTISNALQWRLQFGRAISQAAAGTAIGVENLCE